MLPPAQPTTGLLAATLALMGGLVWVAARQMRAGAERRELARLTARVDQIDERTAAGYMDAYLQGARGRVTP